MKLLMFYFCVLSAFATTYELKEGSQRFTLKADEAGIAYRSEAVSKTFVMKVCNRTLLSQFYASWLKKLPTESAPKGKPFLINGKQMLIDPKSFSNVDASILALVYSEGKACP